MTPTGMSSGNLDARGRGADARQAVGIANGEEHPAERKTFGQKLVDVLTCRCG
jgi:casein kinase 1